MQCIALRATQCNALHAMHCVARNALQQGVGEMMKRAMTRLVQPGPAPQANGRWRKMERSNCDQYATPPLSRGSSQNAPHNDTPWRLASWPGGGWCAIASPCLEGTSISRPHPAPWSQVGQVTPPFGGQVVFIWDDVPDNSAAISALDANRGAGLCLDTNAPGAQDPDEPVSEMIHIPAPILVRSLGMAHLFARHK